MVIQAGAARRVVVVDETGRLTGMVSLDDLLAANSDRTRLLIREFGTPSRSR